MKLYKPKWTDKRTGKTKESQCWHIDFVDNQRIRRRLEAFTNKAESQHAADRITDILALNANGRELTPEIQRWLGNVPEKMRGKLVGFGLIKDSQVSENLSKTLAEHIEGFRDHLTKKEREKKHIGATMGCLQRLFDGCGFVYWSDITGDKIIDYLTEQRDGGRGIGKRTFNGYVKAAKHFCKWLAKQLKTVSPIAYLDGLDNEATDIRHARRAATPDELKRLFETTKQGQERYGLSGYERWLLYWFASETGLRANEIRMLTVGRFDFENKTVMVDAAYSKHRRQDIVPLRAALASELQSYFANKLPTAKAFHVAGKTGNMIQADLADAEIPYIAAGGYFDFHSLRHTFITNLRKAPSRVAQSLARHQSSAMTDRYTHPHLHDERAAIEGLPDITGSEQAKKDTG